MAEQFLGGSGKTGRARGSRLMVPRSKEEQQQRRRSGETSLLAERLAEQIAKGKVKYSVSRRTIGGRAPGWE